MVKHAKEFLDQELVHFWQFIEISAKVNEDCYSLISSKKFLRNREKLRRDGEKLRSSIFSDNCTIIPYKQPHITRSPLFEIFP